MVATMGSYDHRCMVTGISLHGIRASVVVLNRTGDGYQPITLGMTGTYNRYGSIDDIVEDTNTDLVFRYFADRRAEGRFVLHDSALQRDDPAELADVEELLFYLERNNGYDDDWPINTLDGSQIAFSLVAQPVWDALARAATPDRETIPAAFARLFGESTVADDAYRGQLARVSEHVRQLSAVDDYLTDRKLGWAPPGDQSLPYPIDPGEQHSSDDIRRFLAAARRDFAEHAAIRAALDEYERDINAWLQAE